ncbi:hypothetical protein JXA47_12790 [Candidatus Sumerlaeota bacterium]|nr:hypothetical protein [Candidatus Sumerlaeota bacterium]
MAVSQDGTYVLVDHQIIGPGDFQIANIHINPDGTLTNTGHALEFGGKHADIVAIPAQTPHSLLGDANLDGLVDISDAVMLINEALPDDEPILLPQNFANADLDGDIDVDQDDLDELVGMLLGD